MIVNKMKGPKLTVGEVVDRLTNPKWWPNGVVDMNAEVCVDLAPDDDQGFAAQVFEVSINTIDDDRLIEDEDVEGKPHVIITCYDKEHYVTQ